VPDRVCETAMDTIRYSISFPYKWEFIVLVVPDEETWEKSPMSPLYPSDASFGLKIAPFGCEVAY